MQTSRQQLDVYEVTYSDGGVGILLPDAERPTVSMGWDAQDVYRLLKWATFYSPDEVRAMIADVDENAEV